VRDLNLLDSALSRPRNVAEYETPDVARLAAAYAFGVVRNHPFADGNKRTAFVLAELFIELNGHALDIKDADAIAMMLDLAAGNVDETIFAQWLRAHLVA
jgi:death on curing protein